MGDNRTNATQLLRGFLESASNAVAFTGAGISTESGVPDFRSPGSPWLQHKPLDFADFIASPQARAEAWRRKFAMDDLYAGARPGRGHKVLAHFVETGKITGIITQNIDGLHSASGVGPEKIVELHGNGTFAVCLSCDQRHELSVVRAQFETSGQAPACCCGGMVKSATISFGQAMPREPMRRAQALTLACRSAVKTRLPVLQCPSDSSVRTTSTQQFQWDGIEVALTSYKGVIGDTQVGGLLSMFRGFSGTMPDCHENGGCNGLFFRANYQEPQGLSGIRDGTSNTLMVGEDVPAHNDHSAAYFGNGDWASCHVPLNYFPDPPTPRDWWNVISFRSRHTGGGHFCFADGSVHFVNESIDKSVYRALSTKRGNEAINFP